MAASSCPSPEHLRQLLSGTALPAEQEEWSRHVLACSRCRQAAQELTQSEPELVDRARTWLRPLPSQAPPLPWQRSNFASLRKLDGLTTLPASQYRVSQVRALLGPASSLEALGRLEEYEVLELLGQGSMGLVFRGYDPLLKRHVAIKMLGPELASDSVARERFAREAQAAAAVCHPHVVAIHAVSEIEGLPYFVMDHAAGGSLQDFLDHNGPPDWREIARLGAEIAAGLAAAHARGLVHRDIKPANILLRRRAGTAKSPPDAFQLADYESVITDFGLVRVLDESRLTRTGIIAGTPMYMAPEQARCEPIDGRADLFSLGSVLYALCTGREPFPGTTAMAVLRQVCEDTPTPIHRFNPNIPEWLAAVVRRLQARRPEQRFESAAEVAELLTYNQQHPDQPRSVASCGMRRSHRLLALAGFAALLLVGSLTVVQAYHWVGTRPRLLASDNPQGPPLLATLRGHGARVWSLAFSPDGNLLASASDKATVRLWDPSTEKEVKWETPLDVTIVTLAFLHRENVLVTNDGYGGVHLWEAATGKHLPGLPCPTRVGRRLQISPDDSLLLVGGGGQGLDLWDLKQRQLSHTLASNQTTILAAAFSPDSNTLATGDASGLIRLWDARTGVEKSYFAADSLGLRALTFLPDGKTLVSAGDDCDVRFWNVATQTRIGTLAGLDNPVQNLAVSRDGLLLATGGRDGKVKVYELANLQPSSSSGSLQPSTTIPAHQGSVLTLAFSPTSNILATGGEDHLIRLWDLNKHTRR